jgi:hypothetical protein
MRNLPSLASLGVLAVAACGNGAPGALPDPPLLKVISPQRATMQDHAGSILVTGQVTAGPDGSEVESVMVNNVAATIMADGKFAAAIEIQPGATLIHTEAKAKNGGKATDTRAIEAGELRAPGSNIDGAITTAISTQAFAKISETASSLIQQMNFQQLLAPMQPMVHVGDQNGEDCLFARLYVDDLTMTGATISLTPVDGGLTFSAEIDGLDVPGHMRYAAACLHGQNSVDVSASTVTISATLQMTPNGMDGFTATLSNKNIGLSGLNISASGIPGAILDLLPLDGAIQDIVPKAAEMFMQPMLNRALGALAGPKKLMVAGKTIDIQIAPSAINFTDAEGDVTLDTSILIEGAENSNGYVYTDNGTPMMSPGDGLQLGIADDLANEMMSQFSALGMINITQPVQGGTFDAMNIKPTIPPMISADPSDGKMRVVLPDMDATFLLAGKPVAKASLNVQLDVQITPTNDGNGIAVQLGDPVVYLDVLDDIPNATNLTPQDMQTSIQLGLSGQIASLSALLGSLPLPQIAGLQMHNVSVGSETGYVMVKATLE